MNRVLKNVAAFIIILVMAGCLIFTMYYAKNHSSTVNSQMGENSISSNEGLNNQNTDDNTDKSSINNNDTNSNENSSNEDSSTPPDKPDESSSLTPPDKPDGSDDNNGGTVNSNQGGMPSTNVNTNMNSSISIVYYIVFGITSLIIALTLAYLIMSKFNKYSFKDTFLNKDKAVIFILFTLIMMCSFITVEDKILNDYFLNNNSEVNSSTSYSSVKNITSDESISSGDYSSSKALQNVINASGDLSTSISNVNVTKTGDASTGDDTSFYGTNSAIIARNGASVNLKNVNVKTMAVGANGVFSYGGNASTTNTSSDNTTINISNSKITTTKDNSGGIMVTGGGILKATNLTVNTKGISSAAIRSDRGGGKMTVNKGTYTTNGQGSPAVYSTADITVKNAKLVSNVSEGVVIEGKNSVTLKNVTLEDTNSKLNGKSTTYKNIFLYQSMSGDADNGTSSFKAEDSTITTNKGDTIYVTNTNASIILENNKFVNNDTSGNFLRVQGDSWGESGSNGGDVTLSLINQSIKGNITISSISTLSMSMESGSCYEGIINGDNSAKSLKLSLSKDSNIKLTGDSYVSSLDNDDTTNSNIDFNGYKLYVNGVSIN